MVTPNDSVIAAMVWMTKECWQNLDGDIYIICGSEKRNHISPDDLIIKLKEATTASHDHHPDRKKLWREDDIKSGPTNEKGEFFKYILRGLKIRNLSLRNVSLIAGRHIFVPRTFHQLQGFESETLITAQYGHQVIKMLLLNFLSCDLCKAFADFFFLLGESWGSKHPGPLIDSSRHNLLANCKKSWANI